MNKNMKNLIAGAAMAGLLAGTGMQLQAASSNTVDSGKVSLGKSAQNLAETDKHSCKGQNSCKGAGGCKSGDNGCKGKNSCKGKGGCATDGSKK
jgi:hypothetical protein